MCSVTQDRIIVDIKKPIDYKNVFETEIKVGQFSRHQVWPTCGIATSESVIGEFDDIRYFNHPDRFTANILWFTKGYVEYTIPNLIPSNQRITQLSISAELSSELPASTTTGRRISVFTSTTPRSACGRPRAISAMCTVCSPRSGGRRTGISTVC